MLQKCMTVKQAELEKWELKLKSELLPSFLCSIFTEKVTWQWPLHLNCYHFYFCFVFCTSATKLHFSQLLSMSMYTVQQKSVTTWSKTYYSLIYVTNLVIQSLIACSKKQTTELVFFQLNNSSCEKTQPPTGRTHTNCPIMLGFFLNKNTSTWI